MKKAIKECRDRRDHDTRFMARFMAFMVRPETCPRSDSNREPAD